MQKATVKLMLRESKKNALGQMPIYIRVTINRKPVFTSTGHYIHKKHWDKVHEQVKDTHKFHEEINTDIFARKKQILDEILRAAIDKKFRTAGQIKQVIAGELRDIFRFSEKLREEAAGRRADTTIENYRKHMAKLEKYAKGPLQFDHIDPEYLREFEAWLRKNVNTRDGANPNNYIVAIMRTIRKHFNEAIPRGLTSNYPFGPMKYQLPNETAGNKDFLSLSELEKWHQFTFETEHETFKQVALYFLFACYTGLRLSDWTNFTEAKIRGRNISIQAKKNKAWANVPLHDGLIDVIKLMRDNPLTVTEQTINNSLKKLAGHLKIDKRLSTHCGRKSFAVTMCLERGISSETAAKLMGITLAVFEKNYSVVSPEKIMLETSKAWDGLFGGK